MGVLNFINCMVESVYSRSRELAILESMGIGQREIEKNLAKEGMLYIAGGFVPGCLLGLCDNQYGSAGVLYRISLLSAHLSALCCTGQRCGGFGAACRIPADGSEGEVLI